MNILLPNSPGFERVFAAARAVDDIETQVRPHLRRMYEILNRRKGISLGAQQVGIDRAFFVFGGRACGMLFFQTVINPLIVARSPTVQAVEEADLCAPDRKLSLQRPYAITVDFTDLNGSRLEGRVYGGILAQVFIHEIERQAGKSPFRPMAAPPAALSSAIHAPPPGKESI